MFRDINFFDEFIFSTSRSSGPGGQNVNKVNTKVELRFHVGNSKYLSEEEKSLIALKLSTRINSEGFLYISCQTERSQIANKEKCIEKFYKLINGATTKPKIRKASKPTKVSKEKRLESKKRISEIKQNRSKPEF